MSHQRPILSGMIWGQVNLKMRPRLATPNEAILKLSIHFLNYVCNLLASNDARGQFGASCFGSVNMNVP
jgi:hypothetical protein